VVPLKIYLKVYKIPENMSTQIENHSQLNLLSHTLMKLTTYIERHFPEEAACLSGT
jgi:hemerythrin